MVGLMGLAIGEGGEDGWQEPLFVSSLIFLEELVAGERAATKPRDWG